MKKHHANRLRKLADHLKKGKLGHKRFDFSTIHDERDCGTVGCALGECPYAFPRQWEWYKEPFWGDFPTLKTIAPSLRESTLTFFGVSQEEVDHLFYPEKQNPEMFGGKILGNKATRHQVASNIYAFLKVKGF